MIINEMNDNSSMKNIKLYKYRWIIINIYGLYCGLSFFQFMQFTIIADVIQGYYEVDSFLVELTGLVFMIAFIVFFLPVGYIVENTNLRTTSLISVGLTALANCLKLLALPTDRFYLIIVAQSMIAFAQIFMLITPSKVASAWFGAEEVSTACAIGVLGSQIGVALGAAVPSFMVKKGADKDVIADGLNLLFIYNAAISVGVFLLVILFFRSKPAIPPSQSQAILITTEEEKMTFLAALKEFSSNRDFVIVLSTLGLGFGIWNALGIVINQVYTSLFPKDDLSDLGILTLGAIISGGCFGTILFGYILDKTHKFKLVSLLVLFSNTFTFLLQSVFFLSKNKLGSSITVPINGFFSGSLMVIGFEYAIETTYPIPEAYGASVLNVSIYLLAIIYVVVLGIIFDSWGYVAGHILMFISLAFATVLMIFMSPRLRRRDANKELARNSVNEKNDVEKTDV